VFFRPSKRNLHFERFDTKCVLIFILLAPGGLAVERSRFAAFAPHQTLGSSADCKSERNIFTVTNNDIDTGKYREKNGEIRDFIWQHWQQRQIGCLTERRYSKEGVPATTTFTFQNDQANVWTLLVESRWPRTKGADEGHSHIEYRVYSVRRTGPYNHEIPDEEKRQGITYRLVFYDAKGAETGGL
jgi:hypothetical protein